ncbi:MAG TPA: DMT family transporter [Methylomirabilota bacterium]|nr:DMT family transporter [Methylomirabilota bacterium]
MKKGYIYLILAAFSYASMGVLVKVLSIDTGPYLQTFLRLIVSALLTSLIVLWRKKPFLLQNPKDYILIFFMGTIGYGLQIIFYSLALYHNTISNTLFVSSGYPIITAILAHYVLKERLTRQTFVGFALLLIALFLLFDPTNLQKYLLGNMYALAMCFTFSFYIICSKILSKRGNSAETITFWSVCLAVFVSGVGANTFEHITFHLQPTTLFFLVVFGLLNASAFNFVNKGFATVKAGVGTMILLLEPIIGSVLGLLFFHEIPTLIFILGAVLMIAAITLATKMQ